MGSLEPMVNTRNNTLNIAALAAWIPLITQAHPRGPPPTRPPEAGQCGRRHGPPNGQPAPRACGSGDRPRYPSPPSALPRPSPRAACASCWGAAVRCFRPPCVSLVGENLRVADAACFNWSNLVLGHRREVPHLRPKTI